MWESVRNVDEQMSVNSDLPVNVEETNDLNSLHNVDKIPFQRGLVMASLNIGSLLPHIDELQIFMSTNFPGT